MGSYYGIILIGFIFILIGRMNMKGKISSLHWYHRQRVSESDRIPFGKRVGIGTIIIGISAILFGFLSIVSVLLKQEIFESIGMVVFALGLTIGLIFNFYAMIKYNKGIF
jgi:hypothetical protein